MKSKYALVGLATMGIIAGGVSARSETNTVPIEELTLIQENDDSWINRILMNKSKIPTKRISMGKVSSS